MSRVRDTNLPDGSDERARAVNENLRDAKQILNGGMRWQDQMEGGTVTFKWNSTGGAVSGTHRIRTKLKSPPLAVVLLRAKKSGVDGVSSTGHAVFWDWSNGELAITGISDLLTATDYDITLGLVAG